MLTQNQYGFSENLSTYMAVLKLMDDISGKMDNKLFYRRFH